MNALTTGGFIISWSQRCEGVVPSGLVRSGRTDALKDGVLEVPGWLCQ